MTKDKPNNAPIPKYIKAEVLEQIRQEIADCIDGRSHCDEFESGYQWAMNDALEIIDRHTK